MTEKPSLENWDAFSGEWIKADLVSEGDIFVVTGVFADIDNAKVRLIAEIEYHKRAWKFDINRTNQAFIRSKKLTPKQLIGKKLKIGKVKARNPSTGLQVDSLLIIDVS